MMARRIAHLLLALGHCMIASLTSMGQCTNTSLYPGNAITPDGSGLLTTISGCSFQVEYSHITGIVAGASYQFTISDGSYITVHEGSNTGTVLGFGYSPVTVVAVTANDLYPTWNVNAACATAQTCLATTVQRFLDCTPPTASLAVENDCVNDVYYVTVNVTSMGDASGLSITYTENNGPPSIITGVGVGSYELGPFANLSFVDITITHADDPACNVLFNDVTNPPCPVVSCGPDTYTHCYGNSEAYVQTYQGASGYPLQLSFSSGAVSPSGNDALVIRDGLNTTDPILFSGVGNAGDLTGVTVLSTNPDHALTLTMTSNSSFSCADGGVSPPWNYTIGCLDCTSPVASYEVIPDCLHHTYTIAVNVTGLGTGSDVRITDSWSHDTLSGAGLGITDLAPIPVGISAVVTLLNGQNALCKVTSPGLFYPSENCVIPACSELGVEYCYDDAETAWFVYQGEVNLPITLSFEGGDLLPGDLVMLYNGLDTSAQLVFSGNLGGQMSGLTLTSNNASNALTVLVVSDADGSCASGQASVPLNWIVGCGLVGQHEDALNGFEVFPNPTSGELHIRTGTSASGLVRIEILDTMGRLVLGDRFVAVAGAVHPLDIGGVQSGNYAIRLYSSESSWTAHLQLVR